MFPSLYIENPKNKNPMKKTAKPMAVIPLNRFIAKEKRSLKEFGIPRTQNNEVITNSTKPKSNQ